VDVECSVQHRQTQPQTFSFSRVGPSK